MKMKRKNLINLISFFVILALTLFILIQHKKEATLPEKFTQFAIEDTSQIQRIFLADMKGASVKLVKKNHTWYVNDSLPANEDRVYQLLEIMKKIQVKSPVSESAMPNVIRDMASMSVKAEFYTHRKKPEKVLYVGGPTPDYEGTYMSLELGRKKKKLPYIVHIPDFRGYLSDGYFFTDLDEWRSRLLFPASPFHFKEIEINYAREPMNSFSLKKRDINKYEITNPLKEKIPENKLNIAAAKKFIMGFDNLRFVAIDKNISAKKKDSLINHGWRVQVKVITDKNDEYHLYLYPKPSDLRTRVETEEGYDKERYYGILDYRKDQLLILQTLSLQRILWKYDDFKMKK